MTKIFIATPAFDGKVHIQYAIALADTLCLMKMNNIDCVIRISASGSLLVAERNRLIQQFIDSDCTHILAIDSDLGWPPQAILGMLSHNKDFICGVYPARGVKDKFLFRPVLNSDLSIKLSEKGLIKAEYVPAGFMLIKKETIEKMYTFFPELYFEPKNCKEMNPEKGVALFNTEVFEGEFWGEDYVFCRRAMQAGIDIWIDPLIQFDHAGQIGILTQVLTEKNPKKEEVLCQP